MALQASQSVAVPGGGVFTTPAAITPTATDTIAEASFGANGILLVVVTTGTLTNVTVLDPGTSGMGYAGTVPSLAGTATGHRMIVIPRAAINLATGLASITFSGALTGVTYYLIRIP